MNNAMDVEVSDTHLRIELYLPVSQQEAWRALTLPAALQDWWGPYVSLEPNLGGHFVERWDNGTGRAVVTSGTVSGFDPPSVLRLTWSDDWLAQTEVTLTLDEPQPGATRLMLEHRDWEALAGLDRRRLIANHAAGWRQHMASLRDYLHA